MKKVQILGTGCPKCKQLFATAEKAVADSQVEAEVIKIEDMNEILSFGIMMTPALAIDGEVKTVGKVLSVDEIKSML